jgi:sortase A
VSTDTRAVTEKGNPTRIVVESIELDAPVVEMGWRVIEQGGQSVSEWEMPYDEAAWHRNSARPGQGSNTVISGHNESTGGQVFAELEELQLGDEIALWNDQDEPFVYHVVEKTFIRTFANSEEAQDYLKTAMDATPNEQLTLITCWPRWTNTHRLIVVAEPK